MRQYDFYYVANDLKRPDLGTSDISVIADDLDKAVALAAELLGLPEKNVENASYTVSGPVGVAA